MDLATKSYLNGESSKAERLCVTDDLLKQEKCVKTSIQPVSPLKTVPLSADIKLALENNRFLCYNVFRDIEKFHIRQFKEWNDVLIPSKSEFA